MVLVLEDEAVLQMEMELELSLRRGFDVVCVFSSEDAASELDNDGISVACIDIMLCGEPLGLRVARLCQERDLPYLFVSGSTDPMTLEEVDRLSPVAFVKKPVDYDRLASLLRQHGGVTAA